MPHPHAEEKIFYQDRLEIPAELLRLKHIADDIGKADNIDLICKIRDGYLERTMNTPQLSDAEEFKILTEINRQHHAGFQP